MTLKSPVKSLLTLVRYNTSKKEQLLEVGTFLKQAHTFRYRDKQRSPSFTFPLFLPFILGYTHRAQIISIAGLS